MIATHDLNILLYKCIYNIHIQVVRTQILTTCEVLTIVQRLQLLLRDINL